MLAAAASDRNDLALLVFVILFRLTVEDEISIINGTRRSSRQRAVEVVTSDEGEGASDVQIAYNDAPN